MIFSFLILVYLLQGLQHFVQSNYQGIYLLPQIFNTIEKVDGNIITRDIDQHHLDTIKDIRIPLRSLLDADISKGKDTDHPMGGHLSLHEILYLRWIIANYLTIIAIPILHT